jgi:hypothetical protein
MLGVHKVYTHTVSGSAAATVNGVTFDQLDGANSPANFTWNTNGGTVNALTGLGGWDSAAVGLSGSGLEALLSSFTYSGAGTQTFTLEGLTVGQTYQFRFYLRRWGAEGGRFIDFTFTNGSEMQALDRALPMDNPELILEDEDPNSAFYIAYDYTANAASLSVDAATAFESADSLHMYGLSNEVTGALPIKLTLTVSRNGAGELVLDYTGDPDTEYEVTKSSDLAGEFTPLDSPLTVTTDGSGQGQVILPAAETSDAKEFYRIEE